MRLPRPRRSTGPGFVTSVTPSLVFPPSPVPPAIPRRTRALSPHPPRLLTATATRRRTSTMCACHCDPGGRPRTLTALHTCAAVPHVANAPPPPPIRRPGTYPARVRDHALSGAPGHRGAPQTARMRHAVIAAGLEEILAEADTSIDQDPTFTSISLTPRSDGPSRLDSHSSQISKMSQRSVFSLFPRLPTPDFSTFKLNPFHQSLNLFRAPTPSTSTKVSLPAHPSISRTDTTDSTTTSRNSDLFSTYSKRSEGYEGHSHTESYQSGSNNEKPGAFFDDEQHAFFMLTAPSRFTRKFPSCASIGLGMSLPNADAFEILVASENGDDTGVEKFGRWTVYKWCLILSVMTVSPRPCCPTAEGDL